MRTLAVLALAFVLPLAGCLGGEAPAGDAPAPGDGRASDSGAAPVHPEGTPQFCESEDVGIPSGPFAGGCLFWDDDYHEVVVYDLDTAVIDVVIVPPAGNPLAAIEAAGRAVKAWEEGIRAFAQPWFNASFEMNVFVVGEDVPSVDAVTDPEIIVLTSAATQSGVVGIGLEPKQVACELVGGPALRTHATHSHARPGLVGTVAAQDCTGTGFTCTANNVGDGFDMLDLYDLIAHEVGHCLGAGHVGDALDFRARYAPVEDIMSYQSNATQVHCVSTMNVRVLEGVYAHLLDQPEETWLPAYSYFAMPPASYRQAACANPGA
jgi:hypothetical protein